MEKAKHEPERVPELNGLVEAALFVEDGAHPTPVIDRFWFKSVYFREPGGVLFELATDGPGFRVDEDRAHLGESLVLPPWLEPNRAAIKTGLPKLVAPYAMQRETSTPQFGAKAQCSRTPSPQQK